jgi:ATP-dependent DNA helicase RecQ
MRYSETVVSAAQSAPRSGRGLFVMTAHQAKGKEFDAVVLVNASAVHFPDNDEGRRLFYVAITRASKDLTVIVPDANETPLLRHL